MRNNLDLHLAAQRHAAGIDTPDNRRGDARFAVQVETSAMASALRALGGLLSASEQLPCQADELGDLVSILAEQADRVAERLDRQG